MDLIRLIVYVLWLILFIWSVIDIVKAHKSTGWKLLWILVCLLVPAGLGVIIYYFFARQKDMNLPEDFQRDIK